MATGDAAPAKRKGALAGLKRRTKRLRRLRHPLNDYVARYSLVGDPPVFDPAVFPWSAGSPTTGRRSARRR